MIKKLAWLLMCLFLLASCGGGTDMASNGVGSGGTGSYTSGPVSGLGSIIVNGVRYDVENATVTDDDGTPGFDKSSLQLGMYVEVQGASISAAASADDADDSTAAVVKVASDFIGPAQNIQRNVDGEISSFTVFGRLIKTDSKTFYSEAIANGHIVAVYGLVSDGDYTATRVQRLSDSTLVFKLTGKVVAWNTASKQFSFGGRTFEYANDAALPSGFAVGSWVRVRVVVLGIASSPIPVQSVRLVNAAVTPVPAARLKGLIGVLNSQSSFVVNGVRVDASALSLSGLQEMARVEVRGRIVNGVLVATQVEVEDDADVELKKIELHGFATSVSGNTFVVRGLTIYFVPFEGPVSNNECVQVRGLRFNSSFQLVATEVRRNQSDCR